MVNPNRRFKTSIYEQFARIGKAIAHPSRLELLDLLCQGPRTVEVLASEANLGLANTSQHLKVLHAARLVEAEEAGLEVRPPGEYRAGHLPGALSIPLKELERRLSDLPHEREIVAYCRGPYCVLAVEAVDMLRAGGFRAFC